MAPRPVSQVHRIDAASRRGVLLVDDDPLRLAAWTESLARRDRLVVTATSEADALGTLASGLRPAVIVANMLSAPSMFARVSAMPRFWDVRFVAIAERGAADEASRSGSRLARLVAAMLEESDDTSRD